MCCYKTFFSTVGSDFDFRATIFTVTFAAGIENVLVHIQIPIVDDMNAEEAETFTAKLTSTDQSVQIINDTATVNIFDDDGEARMLDKPTKTELNVQYMLFLMSELEVYLINESPRVTASSIEAEFVVNGPVTGVRCFLRSQVDRLWQDCKTLFSLPCCAHAPCISSKSLSCLHFLSTV